MVDTVCRVNESRRRGLGLVLPKDTMVVMVVVIAAMEAIAFRLVFVIEGIDR